MEAQERARFALDSENMEFGRQWSGVLKERGVFNVAAIINRKENKEIRKQFTGLLRNIVRVLHQNLIVFN